MTTREMREKRGQIAAQMAELTKQTPLSPENRAKFDAMDTEQEQIRKDIEAVERAEAIGSELRANGNRQEAIPGDVAPSQEERAAQHSKLFRKYLSSGFTGLNEQERGLLTQYENRTTGDGIMGTGGGNALDGSGGGYFVPVGFVNKVTEGLKWYGGMLDPGVCTIMDTDSGQPLPFPTDNDTANTGELVGENSTVGTQEITLSNVTLGAYQFSTKMVKVSIAMLQDSAFDVESWLQKKFSTRLGRTLNNYFTLGSGTSQPKGIVVAASAGVTATGDDNATTPAPTTQVGYIDLVNLEHSVDKAYRNGAKFMWHDVTLAYLKTLKDKYGRPLWVPGMTANAPDTVNGYAYVVNNDMANVTQTSPASARKTVLFGDLSQYTIRRVKGLSVLRLSERFAELGQVAFIGFARYDGNLLDPGTKPVKYITNPAS